jgi:hypothetical protein
MEKAEITAKRFEDNESFIVGYQVTDVFEFVLYMKEEFFDAMIELPEKGEEIDNLINFIRNKEEKRLQEIFDKVLGKDEIIIICE